ETGFLSPSRERTMSVLCEEDSEIYTMHEDKAIEIFHSDPSLVLKMIQLTVKRSLENLKITVAEKERIESDLRIARDIQASTLPHVFPPFPERNEIEIFASMQAAKEVGGDFYDFFFVDEDRLAFIIGDVSGKGVPAALFMMTTKILLKNEALRGLPADEILYHVNNILSPDNETSMFVTILCGILDTATGELQIGNAGHLPPLLCKEGQDLEFLDLPRNFVLGPMEGTPFPSYKTGLRPGETLFFYTDGVTEAMNTRGEFFEAQRFKEVVSALKNNNLTEIINGVRKEIGDFAEGAEQSDDITMLAVRFYGKNERRP
ncbi:MAG: PP2C family protein-serine/threonine phosphatase, partial [Pseudomonadota bacterium]